MANTKIIFGGVGLAVGFGGGYLITKKPLWGIVGGVVLGTVGYLVGKNPATSTAGTITDTLTPAAYQATIDGQTGSAADAIALAQMYCQSGSDIPADVQADLPAGWKCPSSGMDGTYGSGQNILLKGTYSL